MFKRFIRAWMLTIKETCFVAIFAAISFLTLVPLFTWYTFADNIPSKEQIMNNNDTGITLLDRNGVPFFTFYGVKKKEFIPIDQIPVTMQLAVVSMEDHEFYQHNGFSPKGIVRAAVDDIQHNQLLAGGSTITQQLVKNSLLTSQKSFLRKYKEIVMAAMLETHYSKQEILEMYLNSAYFGEGAFGVKEAAKVYFGKEVQDLTLGEASMLAAILPAPSDLSPISGDYNAARARQELVLDRMLSQGFITKEQQQQALAESMHLAKTPDSLNQTAPHFALMVKDELVKEYGEEAIARSGLKIKTSLDLSLQQYAQQAVSKQVTMLATNKVSNGAAVVIDPKTGEILALVGSSNWYDPKVGKINMAITPRQPGSSFKPIIYSAAFEKGLITPATMLQDSPITYLPSPLTQDAYSPHDYDGRTRGTVTVRRALANSLNIPAVEVLSKLGINPGLEMAQRLGITTLQDSSHYGLSFVLGSGEVPLLQLTGAYSAFANGGYRVDPTDILEITDKNNQVLYQYQPDPVKVLKPEDAFFITSILSDVNARKEEFGNLLNISKPAAVKTGTSEDYRDSLTIGFTPSVVVGVWVGNSDNEQMDKVAGSLGAAPIWKSIMEQYLANKPVEPFMIPTSIEKSAGCIPHDQAGLATGSATLDYFVKGTSASARCTALK